MRERGQVQSWDWQRLLSLLSVKIFLYLFNKLLGSYDLLLISNNWKYSSVGQATRAWSWLEPDPRSWDSLARLHKKKIGAKKLWL